MIIRKMTIADYDSVYDLWLNTRGWANSLDDSKQGMKNSCANARTCFVTEKDNRIIGVILCGNDGRRIHLPHCGTGNGTKRESEPRWLMRP